MGNKGKMSKMSYCEPGIGIGKSITEDRASDEIEMLSRSRTGTPHHSRNYRQDNNDKFYNFHTYIIIQIRDLSSVLDVPREMSLHQSALVPG